MMLKLPRSHKGCPLPQDNVSWRQIFCGHHEPVEFFSCCLLSNKNFLRIFASLSLSLIKEAIKVVMFLCCINRVTKRKSQCLPSYSFALLYSIRFYAFLLMNLPVLFLMLASCLILKDAKLNVVCRHLKEGRNLKIKEI